MFCALREIKVLPQTIFSEPFSKRNNQKKNGTQRNRRWRCVLCIHSWHVEKKDWWGYALLEWPTCEAYLFSFYIRILFLGDWSLSPDSPSCQFHCQLFLACVVECEVTVFFRSKLNSSSVVTLAQASKQCAPLRIALLQKSSGAHCLFFQIWSCCLRLRTFLMWQEIFLLLLHQMYYCVPLQLLRVRESSAICQMLSYPFSGEQRCHYRLLYSYQSS